MTTKDFTYEKNILESIGMNSDLPDVILENLNYVHLVENYYFRKRNCKDYRNASIDFAIKNKLNFSSSQNTYNDFMRRFVKVSCPTCNMSLTGKGGGGTSGSFHTDYYCDDCKVEVSLSGNPEGAFDMRYR